MPSHKWDYAAEYGDECAEFYDQIYSGVDSALLHRLRELSAGGPVLELGIGTGRVALPLSAMGVDVSGIESSGAMISRLRSKPDGWRLKIVRGNFADGEIVGSFSLIFAVASTFFLLRSAEEQQRCLNNAKRLLAENGLLVLENFMPLGARLIHAHEETDPQIYVTQQILEMVGGRREYRARLCYASPQQLDEKAKVAGLMLRDRWSDWHGKPFTPDHKVHISVYRRD